MCGRHFPIYFGIVCRKYWLPEAGDGVQDSKFLDDKVPGFVYGQIIRKIRSENAALNTATSVDEVEMSNETKEK